MIFLHRADVAERPAQGPDAREISPHIVDCRAFAVPESDPLGDRHDGETGSRLPRGTEGGLRDSDHGHRGNLAHRRQPRISERGDEHRVAARPVFGVEGHRRIGADGRLAHGLDVGHPERCGYRHHLRPGTGRPPRLRRNQGGDAVRDVGIDDEELHRSTATRTPSCRTRGEWSPCIAGFSSPARKSICTRSMRVRMVTDMSALVFLVRVMNLGICIDALSMTASTVRAPCARTAKQGSVDLSFVGLV